MSNGDGDSCDLCGRDTRQDDNVYRNKEGMIICQGCMTEIEEED